MRDASGLHFINPESQSGLHHLQSTISSVDSLSVDLKNQQGQPLQGRDEESRADGFSRSLCNLCRMGALWVLHRLGKGASRNLSESTSAFWSNRRFHNGSQPFWFHPANLNRRSLLTHSRVWRVAPTSERFSQAVGLSPRARSASGRKDDPGTFSPTTSWQEA